MWYIQVQAYVHYGSDVMKIQHNFIAILSFDDELFNLIQIHRKY